MGTSLAEIPPPGQDLPGDLTVVGEEWRRAQAELGPSPRSAQGPICDLSEISYKVRFRLEFGGEMAETFLWTSLANEACVVEADRQTDL